MTKIQLYRDERGGWSFYAAEGRKVDAELADGYRLGERPNGQLCIMGAPGELAMRASEAVRRRVVRIPMFWPSYSHLGDDPTNGTVIDSESYALGT